LELAVAVVLIGIFITVFVQRVILLTVAAEATSLEQMIRNLRTVMMLYSAEQLLEGKPERIEKLAESYPFDVMDIPYGNYGGTKTTEEMATAQPGQWFYDNDNHELVYKVINGDYFRNARGTDLVRLKTILNFDDRNHNGSYERGIDRPRGVSLQLVDDYEWTF